jgi:hypothetical protein
VNAPCPGKNAHAVIAYGYSFPVATTLAVLMTEAVRQPVQVAPALAGDDSSDENGQRTARRSARYPASWPSFRCSIRQAERLRAKT